MSAESWWIEVISLRTTAALGLTQEERALPQPVELNLKIIPSGALADSDDLADTVDYGVLVSLALRELSETHRLLETYVARICNVLLEFPGVGTVRVSLTKCAPPLDATLSGVTVVCERSGCDVP